MKSRFLKHSFIYTVVGALPLAASILLLPFYGNKYLLTTEQFGLLAIYILLSDLSRLAFTFALDNYLGVNYIHFAHDNNLRKAFIGTGFLLMLLIGGSMLLVFSVMGKFILDTIYTSKNLVFFPYGFVSLLTGFFTAIFKGYSGLMIYQQKPKPYFWAHMLHFSIVVIVSMVWLNAHRYSLDGPIYARLLGSVATFLWSLAYALREGSWELDKKIVRDAISFSLPLWIFYILFWIISNIDRYIILSFLSAREVAIFDMAIKVTLLLEFLQNGLSGAILPEAFKIWKNYNDVPSSLKEINRYFNAFSLITLWGVPTTFIATLILLPLFVNNQELYQAIDYLPILLAGMIIRSWYYYEYGIITYFKRTRILAWTFAIVAAIQILFTYVGVKYASLEGAMWANFSVKILQVFILYLAIRSWFQFKPDIRIMFIMPLLFIVIVLIAYFFHFLPWQHAAVQSLGILILTFLFFRKPMHTFREILSK